MRDALKSVFDNDYQGYPIFLDKVIRPVFGDDLEVLPVKDDISIDIDHEALKKANIKSIYRVAQIDSDTDVDVVLGCELDTKAAHISLFPSEVGV